MEVLFRKICSINNPHFFIILQLMTIIGCQSYAQPRRFVCGAFHQKMKCLFNLYESIIKWQTTEFKPQTGRNIIEK